MIYRFLWQNWAEALIFIIIITLKNYYCASVYLIP